jgi:hypothetical protein
MVVRNELVDLFCEEQDQPTGSSASFFLSSQ